MTKKICGYCEEEKEREDLLYSRALYDYVCKGCLEVMGEMHPDRETFREMD